MVDLSHAKGAELAGTAPTVASRLAPYALPIFLILMIIVAGIISPAFLSRNNISNMLLQMAPLGIVVIGQAFVIILRGLDS